MSKPVVAQYLVTVWGILLCMETACSREMITASEYAFETSVLYIP